jgi:hypothetical protein
MMYSLDSNKLSVYIGHYVTQDLEKYLEDTFK